MLNVHLFVTAFARVFVIFFFISAICAFLGFSYYLIRQYRHCIQELERVSSLWMLNLTDQT